MNRKSVLTVLLAFALGAAFGVGRAAARLTPSSDLLLPSFEVDLAGQGMTTLLGVTNALDQPVQALATVYTNWGIPVLQVSLAFDPHQVRTVNLHDWIVLGQLPDGPLGAEPLAHVQAALAGERSPRDGLFYSTLEAPDHAMGYVVIRIQGGTDRPAALFGDFFTMGPGQAAASGDTLVDIRPSTSCSDLCSRHALRFLSGAAFSNGTQMVIWTSRSGQPEPSSDYPAGALVTAHARLYDEAGHLMAEHDLALLPMEIVNLSELAPPTPFGWVDLEVGTGSFIGVRYSGKTTDSVAFQSACLPDGFNSSVPGLSISKITNGYHSGTGPGPTLAMGSPVTWSYVVRNTGQVPLTGVTVSDDQKVAVQCPKTTLDPLEQMICTGKGTAVACQYKNIGTVLATPPSGPVIEAQDASYYYGDPAAALTLVLSTNGQHATAPPGSEIPAGSRVTWTYLVTNTGKSTLTGVAITDDHGVAVSCPRSSLAAGASMTCTASGTAVAGQYANMGTVTGQPPCGPSVQAQDHGYYHTPRTPGICLVKSTNGQSVAGPPGPQLPVGSRVSWTYLVTNCGQVSLSNVHVTDNRGVAVTCPKSALVAGEVMTCTGYGTATACQYSNVGTASGAPPTGAAVTAQDQSWYFGTSNPALQIKKSINGQHVTAAPGPTLTVGAAVTWTYGVTNSGDVALTNVAVTDDQHVAVSCPKSTLAAGETMTCTGSGTAISGQYHNVGMATGQPPCGSAVSANDSSWYYGQSPQPPGISIKKYTNGQYVTCAPGPHLAVGGAVTWTYKVTNTGQVTLSNVHVTDNRGVAVTCPKSTLVAGEAMTCTGSGTATACQYNNTGTATGTSPTGATATATDQSWYYGNVNPAIQIKKNTNGQHVTAAPGPTIAVGGAVTWTYVVTNSGDVALSNVVVSDDHHVSVSCPKSTLQPGETMTCTGSGTAVAGQYHNVGTATGQPPCGSAVSASDSSWYYGQSTTPPGIAIKKSTNGQYPTCAPGPHVAVGSAVTWTYKVTNTGQSTLSNVQVTDNRGVAVTCPKSTLVAGEVMTCTGYGTAVACQYNNTGTATGTSPTGATATATDQSWYYGNVNPAIQIKKNTNGQHVTAAPGPTINVGGAVTWTYVVTNSGDVALSNVVVSDDHHVSVSCPKSTLQSGETMTCTGSGTAVAGQYHNVGTATGQPPCGSAVSASDSSWYYGQSTPPPPPPSIAIKKYTNGQYVTCAPGPTLTVGSAVTWTYTVTNNGQVSLTNVQVTDNRGVAVTCPKSTLAVGESMTCTGSGTAVAGQYNNTGTTTGTSPSGTTASAHDDSWYYGQAQQQSQGCSPGYWKNHPSAWSATGYSTGQIVSNVFHEATRFPSLGSSTLLQALSFQGGSGLDGAAQTLLRAAVAALLNAADSHLNYPRQPSAVISSVNSSLSSGDRNNMQTLASQLDTDNNLSCPLY